MPKFVLKDMEGLYIEEMNISISTLRGNLESLPVQQGEKNGKKSIIRGIKPRSLFLSYFLPLSPCVMMLKM